MAIKAHLALSLVLLLSISPFVVVAPAFAENPFECEWDANHTFLKSLSLKRKSLVDPSLGQTKSTFFTNGVNIFGHAPSSIEHNEFMNDQTGNVYLVEYYSEFSLDVKILEKDVLASFRLSSCSSRTKSGYCNIARGARFQGGGYTIGSIQVGKSRSGKSYVRCIIN